MKATGSIRGAKEFLAGKIAEEAEREGVSLSEVERKMLYFSEEGWTLPGMLEINAEFDRDYDQDEYEAKIAGLVRNWRKWAQKASRNEFDSWNAAVLALEDEDHYLSVLVRAPSWLAEQPSGSKRPPGDLLRLWLTAFAIVLVLIAGVVVVNWIQK